MTKTEEFANALNAYMNIDVHINKTLRLIGISAIKKQIPKKALFSTVNSDTAYYCSSCENFVGFYDTHTYEYCHNCGQKLDWGEQNEQRKNKQFA